MKSLNFEEFIEYTWDYVSENVVSDEYWDNNHEFIREITYNLYRLYEKNIIKNSSGEIILEKLDAKMCGKILESTFLTIIRFNN